MKNLCKKALLLLIITFFMCFNINTKAANYVVVTDSNGVPRSLSNVKVLGENVWYNGYHGLPFQYVVLDGQNRAVLCTSFRDKRPGGTTATCTLNNWPTDIRVGVAEIIKQANMSNSSMSQQYYYADIAINYYLFENLLDGDQKNYANQVTSYPVTQNELNAVLGELGKAYYDAAEDAVERYKEGLKVNKPSKISGQQNWLINAENRDNIVNSYKITGSNVDSFNVSVSLKNASSGVKVYMKKGASGTFTETRSLNNVSNNDEIFVKVANFDEGENITVNVKVTGKMNYYLASNYACKIGEQDYQSLTINELIQDNLSKSNSASFTIRTYEAPEYPDLKIVKKDQNGNNVNGAELTLYEKVNDTLIEIETFDANDQSQYEYDDLEVGTYCVVETAAPSGYLLQDDEHCFTINKDATTNAITVSSTDSVVNITDNLITVTITDAPNTVKIRKKNEQGNYLANTKLKLVRADGGEFKINGVTYNSSTGYVWTTTNEDLEINGLRNGLYRVYEVEAAPGYIKTDDYRQFRITSTLKNPITVVFPNQPIVLNVKKIDIVSQEELEGAQMEILYMDGQGNKQVLNIDGSPQQWTSNGSAHVVRKIPAGTYYLRETLSPDGYKLKTEEIEFTIDEYGKVTINEEPQTEALVVMSNEKNSVYISKRDITTKEELPGAYLQITDLNGNIVKTIDGKSLKWKSTDKPYLIEGLRPNIQYVLTETIAPDGYVLSKESVVFSIDEEGHVIINNKNIQDSIVIMTNAMNEVSLSKQDITTKQELPGATLRLLDEDGEIVYLNGEYLEWVSTDTPRIIKGLPAGTYSLVEITAPEGYTKTEESITFTIDENGVVSGDTVMYNTPKPPVPKTDASTSILIIFVGLSLLGLGVGLYIYGIKKKKEN